MRRIEPTGSFKRDYKRIGRSPARAVLTSELPAVIDLLASDQALAPRHRDHALSGDWTDHRDCHLRPDLVLIYRKPDAETLQLVRLGSHSELGLWPIDRCS